MKKLSILIVASTLIVSANGVSLENWNSKKDIKLGQKLFKNNCASCHGDAGSANVFGFKRLKNGKMPPPPLNGQGKTHIAHHSPQMLDKKIANGAKNSKEWMPAFKGKLNPQERLAIIKYIHSMWSKKLKHHYDKKFKIKDK